MDCGPSLGSGEYDGRCHGWHLSMFFCDEEGTVSSFHGIGQTIARHGCSACSTPTGQPLLPHAGDGGKVDKNNPTQVGRRSSSLASNTSRPITRGAGPFGARLQNTSRRLPQELAKASITNMADANRYLEQVYLPQFNAEFMVPASAEGTAFIPYIGNNLPTCCASSMSVSSATTIA